MERLKKTLSEIDKKGYRAYKRLKGSYDFRSYRLFIDHVQGDPFASPSKFRTRVPLDKAGFSARLFSCSSRKTALEDYLARQFEKAIKSISKGRRGTGRSGVIHIDSGGQEIIQRTAFFVCDGFIEARFYVGLPARGRTVLGDHCLEIIDSEIPRIVGSSMFYKNIDSKELKDFLKVCEDQDHMRAQLDSLGLVSFIKNRSILPRRSGISQKPLPESETVLFESPEELETEIELPNAGIIKGMGVPKGITIIIGGGFHGKSTLLTAIEKGVYNHIPGDGREYVSTIPSAVKIRAEEGRSIQKVDISPFISDLPMGRDTLRFSTANASGSTSQAANIMEALECDTRLLMLDEDTSATNFLIRDDVMQKIVPKQKEPITPFIDQVLNIYKEYHASSILVMGGSSDYFSVCDNVILMDNYRPVLVTSKAKKAYESKKEKRIPEAVSGFKPIRVRIPIPASFDPYRGKRKKIKTRGFDEIIFGSHNIDLSAVSQIVDTSQVNAISAILEYSMKKSFIDGENDMRNILDRVFEDIEKYGLEILSFHEDGHPGSYAMPRRHEVAAAINRLRALKVRQK